MQDSISLTESVHARNCTLCRSPLRLWQHVPTDSKKGTPNVFANVYFCDPCGYGRVLPIPSEAEVAEFYRLSGYYTHRAPRAPNEAPKSLLDRLRLYLAWRSDHGTPTTGEFVHRALAERPSTILDLGCGDGALAADLSRLGHQVVGVEADPQAISRVHARRFEIHAGTAEALPAAIRCRRFDCVVMRHVLEHTREPLEGLRNARSVLVPGGKLICEVPNNQALAFELVGCAWDMFDLPRHLHFFTPTSLTRICEVAGFRVKSVYFGHYLRQFTNTWIQSERMRFRALVQDGDAPEPEPRENSRLLAWYLLAATLSAPPERKYDSTGVVAVNV